MVVSGEQIDLEEAIAERCPTVRAYAEKYGVSIWRVRRSIELGTLSVNDRVRPMVITEGELAVSVDEWQRILRPALSRIKPHQYGWEDGGKKLVLLNANGKQHTWSLAVMRQSAESQLREIGATPVRRIS